MEASCTSNWARLPKSLVKGSDVLKELFDSLTTLNNLVKSVTLYLSIYLYVHISTNPPKEGV